MIIYFDKRDNQNPIHYLLYYLEIDIVTYRENSLYAIFILQ